MSTAARLALSDPIYSRIAKAVPRSVDPMLREDIMSDIYLGIREGRLHPRDIATMAKVYISAGYAAFANRWGAVSIDAVLPGTDDLRIVDMIEDPQALDAFDHIEIRSRARLPGRACAPGGQCPARRVHSGRDERL